MWPFVTRYPELLPSRVQQEYDYIVVGGGTAGCVLARRLAEERNSSVLLIERGDTRDNWLDKSPLFSTHQFSDKKHSVVLQSRLRGDATTDIVTGRGLGGTSRINGMHYTRGVPGDYNAWAESGRQGWSYEELKPYFERAEGHWSPAPPPNFKFEASREIAHAAEKLGFAICNDVNDARLPTSGCFLLHLTTAQDGYRSSTFRAYLPKHFVLAHRDNLHICTKTIACKVEVEQSATGTLRATGVVLQEAKPGSSTRFVAARKEVVLCCGAITTPQLLMLSGIGPANHLQQVGVPVVHELDGVGSNLQDHMGTPLYYYAPIWDTWIAPFLRPWWLLWQLLRFLILGDGWLRDHYMESSVYTRADYLDEDMRQKVLDEQQRDATRPDNVPDIEIMTVLCDFTYPDYDKSKGGYTMLATALRPHSRGTVRLRSSDSLDPPLIDLDFLSAPADRKTLRTAVRLCMRIAGTMRAGGY
ncbi:uncharacterized protein PHACADRAFT_68181, partial [Phanerochaete carnosa HHB-10118-sp]